MSRVGGMVGRPELRSTRVGVSNDEPSVVVRGMMRRPTLFLTVGLPAPVRSPLRDQRGRTECPSSNEGRMGQGAVRAGRSAVGLGRHRGPACQDRLARSGTGHQRRIDYGLWGRDKRSALRKAAADRGALVEMCYFELPSAEPRRRLDQRVAEESHATWDMSDEELAQWAASIDVATPDELDGSEPLDKPRAGYTTWDEWPGHRWPRASQNSCWGR